MKQVYFRCIRGDYFAMGGACPLDGCASPESLELLDVAERVTAAGRDLSLAELRRAGLSDAALARTIVIEFGSEASAFELIAPLGYVVDNEWKSLEELDERFN